jgi:hypothetical protein
MFSQIIFICRPQKGGVAFVIPAKAGIQTLSAGIACIFFGNF